jgi:hypothetical protein
MTTVLIGCTKEKLPAEAPARELYQGRLFLASVQYAEAIGARWFVLSAAHGLVDPDAVIEPYDVALARLNAADRETWRSTVAVQLKRHVPETETLVVLAGREYAGWRELVPHAVEEPLVGLSVGARFARLKTLTRAANMDAVALDDALGFLRDAVKHDAEALLSRSQAAALLARLEARAP